MLTTIGVTAIVVTVLCTIVHEWDIRDYKRRIEYIREERNHYIDRYYNLQNKIIGIEEQTDQLSNTPDDYTMD